MPDVSTCTACHAPIRWVLTIAGRRMPLDLQKVDDGNILPVEVEGQRRARVLTGAELPVEGGAWQSHHRSCPNAADFRRRKAATTPTCPYCRLELHPALVADGSTAHPLCGPPPDFRDRVDPDPAPAGQPGDADPDALFDLNREDDPR